MICISRLCKLLTNPITEVKDLAADLLFVLCKESGKTSVKTLQKVAQYFSNIITLFVNSTMFSSAK